MAKLLFLQNIDYEFLGPMYISAMVKKSDHECRLTLGQTITDFQSELESLKPDIIGFSTMSGSHRWAVEMARTIKRDYGIPTILGGAHPTFFPQVIEETGVDMILRGEGEESVLELLNRIDARQSLTDIPNIWFKNGTVYKNDLRSLRFNLDDYPFPDRSLYDSLNGKLDRSVRNVITSRGCPWHCSFCFEDTMREIYEGKGKYVRIRTIDKVIEECIELKSSTEVRVIYFADDVFGMSKKWLYEFLPRYKHEVGLPFICLVRADIVASDRDYAFRLAEGGCQSVFFGVESGNEELRNRILVKQLSDKHIKEAAKNLHESGIPFRTYNIVALPGERLDDAFSTVELNIAIKTDYPWCSVFFPFPGTALTRHAIDQGFLDKDFDPEKLTKSFFTESKLITNDIHQLENLQKFFQTAVLLPWTFSIIKKLIKLPPNIFFIIWFGLVYFYVYWKSERRSFWKTLFFAFKNYRHVLSKQ
ncbi:MAG: B12-binding domain-containing radical SAM protein [Ignavibacteriae bacterium]|nr:B12-binding domain-containing radical SAM protein [Ignavibacteriota bacterium]